MIMMMIIIITEKPWEKLLRKNGVVDLGACIDEINLAFLICILHKTSSCLLWLCDMPCVC